MENRINKIEQRLAALTSKSWFTASGGGVFALDSDDCEIVLLEADETESDFIANAPSDIAYLIAEVKRMGRERDAVIGDMRLMIEFGASPCFVCDESTCGGDGLERIDECWHWRGPEQEEGAEWQLRGMEECVNRKKYQQNRRNGVL